MTRLFHVLGFTDSVHTCDCCGKSNLKGTFGIQMIDSGDVLYYGSTCVTRNTGKPKKEINQMAREYHEAQVKLARAEYRSTPECAAYQAKLDEARKAGLLGVEFKNYCAIEREADHAVEKAICAKYGVASYEI
jgi:hypothetical protein